VDGVPVNSNGGGFDYAGLQTTGVESVEVLRDANSVVYRSDAMAGVLSVTTRRGQTRTPELGARPLSGRGAGAGISAWPAPIARVVFRQQLNRSDRVSEQDGVRLPGRAA
jgi:outer membrane receptor protein involved in Fe transport